MSVSRAPEVEAGARLVEQQQVGVGHQRPGDRGPPPFARGQRRVRVVGDAADPEAVEQAARPRPVVVGVDVPPRLRRRVTGGHDQGRPASGRGGATPRRRSPRSRSAAGARANRPCRSARRGPRRSRRSATARARRREQGRLAGPVRAEHDPALTGPDRPVERSEDRPPGAPDDESPNLDDGRRLVRIASVGVRPVNCPSAGR